MAFRLAGVIAQEIHRLAQLRHGVNAGFSRFAREKGEDLAMPRLIEIRGAPQDLRAVCDRRRPPWPGPGERGLHIRGRGVAGITDGVGGIGWVCNRVNRRRVAAVFMRCAGAGVHRFCAPQISAKGLPRRREGRLVLASVEVPAPGVRTRPPQLRRLLNGRTRWDRLRPRRKGIGRDRFWRDPLIQDLIYKGGIGAVLQQPPHQIREQIAMRSHRRVNPAARAFRLAHEPMQRLAHAVKALKLKGAPIPRQRQDRRDGVGVVGGELRIDPIGHGQELLSARNKSDVGGGFASEHWEIRDAVDLGALNFGVPIRTLHQPHHNAPVQRAGEGVEPLNHRGRALAIGLHHDAEAVPPRQSRVAQHRLGNVQREIEAVGLLGVDVQAKPARFGVEGEGQHPRRQLTHDARALGELIARVQRRELDGDAGIVANVRRRGARRKGRDRRAVGLVIRFGVARRQRRLPQHVIGVREALGFVGGGARQRALNRFAEHEVAAEFLHRPRHRRANDRLAHPFD